MTTDAPQPDRWKDTEPGRVAQQIHDQWPFIPKEDAFEFYESLFGISAAEGSVRVSLWVLQRVIEHRLTK